MPQPHEQIASDQHWMMPPDIELPSMGGVPLLTKLHDYLLTGAVLASVDRAYDGLTEQGVFASERPAAEGSGLYRDGLLKIVEDMRLRPKAETRRRRYVSQEEFDEQAREMIGNLLFRGPQVGTKVETDNGIIEVARRVVYYQNSASRRMLIGKSSDLIGKNCSELNAVLRWPGEPVGYVHRYETRKDRVERRVVSAQLLRPNSPDPVKQQAMVHNLGILSVLNTNPGPNAMPGQA